MPMNATNMSTVCHFTSGVKACVSGAKFSVYTYALAGLSAGKITQVARTNHTRPHAASSSA